RSAAGGDRGALRGAARPHRALSALPAAPGRSANARPHQGLQRLRTTQEHAMADKVQLDIKAPIATITLNKPDRLNALDVEMWEAIGHAADQVSRATDVRVAVLTGAGGAFCAGLDLKAGSTLSRPAGETPPQALAGIRAHLKHLQECFSRLESCRVPVIAAIQRVCIGGGVGVGLRRRRPSVRAGA